MSNNKKNPFSMSGKIALITGSSGLLGVEHSSALLESGASVVMTDIDEKGLIKAYDALLNSDNKGRIFYKVMDVTNEENIQEVASELKNDKLIIIYIQKISIILDENILTCNTSKLRELPKALTTKLYRKLYDGRGNDPVYSKNVKDDSFIG